MMALDATAIKAAYLAILSHVSATGAFRAVNGHEAKSALHESPTAAMWADYLGPATGSGLAETSALLVVNVRAYAPMITQTRPEADAMDPKLLSAVSAVIGRLVGDLTLGGTVRCVDIRGISGRRLEARAGYLEVDRSMQRVLTLQVPIIINDAWAEAP